MKPLIQVLNIFHDLITLFLRQNKSDSYKSAFIVHPRTRSDIERKYPFFKYVPNHLIDFFTKYFWPLTLSKITGLKSLKSGKEIEGYVISVLPTAYQMFENRSLALHRITQACTLAKKK